MNRYNDEIGKLGFLIRQIEADRDEIDYRDASYDADPDNESMWSILMHAANQDKLSDQIILALRGIRDYLTELDEHETPMDLEIKELREKLRDALNRRAAEVKNEQ